MYGQYRKVSKTYADDDDDSSRKLRRCRRPRSAPPCLTFVCGNKKIERCHYGKERSKPQFFRKRNKDKKKQKQQKPKPPKEEIAKTLEVDNVDLKVKLNAKKHNTDEYDCTDEEGKDGKPRDQECVVRRGDAMTISVSFIGRPYEKAKHDMRLCFKYGEKPNEVKNTKAVMKLDESGEGKFKPDEWGANLVKIEGKEITVDIHIPCNCIIGEWNLDIITIAEGKDKDGKDVVKEFIYEHQMDINILFNPWCKDDLTYCSDTDWLKEYLLMDYGYVYQGTEYRPSPKDWMFGQYEFGVLEEVLDSVRDSLKPGSYGDLADPIQVSRIVAHVVNEQILLGNWSGQYEDGKAPWKWVGSKRIIQHHTNTKALVKYGQCWVFSGVTTTFCRALGIPCRSVTNFGSAHDCDASNTIDKYYVFNEQGELVQDKYLSSDSVWNFHVWNEVWLKRPDLDPNGRYDGWQVIDATPQEKSQGIYTCGPASLVAIKEGNCLLPYDTGFVFAEVNADQIDWIMGEDGTWNVMERKKKNIGNSISTKGCLSYAREDLTNLYKHPEGSVEEREAVELAQRTAGRPKPKAYDIKIKKVKFNLLHKKELMLGQDMEVEVKATNNGRYDRTIKYVRLEVEPMSYTGDSDDPFINVPLIKPNQKIGPGKCESWKYTIKAKEYTKHLTGVHMNIKVTTRVDGVGEEEEEDLVKEHKFVFGKPELTVEMPKEVKVRQPVEVKVKFTNPFDFPLSQLFLSVDAAALELADDKTGQVIEDDKPIPLKDVPPMGECSHSVKMIPLRAKKCAMVEINISSDRSELFDISGKAECEIKKK